MKGLFICIITGLVLTATSYTQTYHPFPTDSVYWVEMHQGPYMGGTCIESSYTYIYSTQDLLINGLPYTEYMARTEVTYQHFGPPPSSCPPNGYVTNDYTYAFLRNDSINKKVWFYDSTGLHADLLLYDFNISTGDTIQLLSGYNSPCGSDTFIAGVIDSVDIGGEYRKRYEILSTGLLWSPLYLIEGIGSNYGMAFNQYCPFEYTSELVCYHFKDLEYGNTSSAYCTSTLSTEDLPETADLVRSLNGDILQVNGQPSGVRLELFDLGGKMLHSTVYFKSETLDLSSYSPGVYIAMATVGSQPCRPLKFMVSH